MTEPQAPIDPGTAWTPAAPEPTTGTAPLARSAGASTRLRWIVAGLVLVLVVGLTIGAGLLLSGRATPEALGYIPSSMTAVAEVRMDLPGDQLQKVGNLLAHFPGFKDQSTLSEKITESLSKLTTRVSGGAVDYATKIAPWIAGPLFAGFDLDPTKPGEPNGVLVATTDGKADCATLFTGSTKTSTVGSLALLTNADGTLGCALDGRFALIGSPATIQAALDAHSKHAGMDQDATYRTARQALGGDQLATYYVSGRLYDELPQMLASLPGASAIPANPFGGFPQSATTPSWLVAGLHAEDDAVVFDAVAGPPRAVSAPSGAPAGSPPPSLLTAAPDHAGRIASLVPGDALAMADVHGAGIGLENLLTILRSEPALQSALGQVDTALAAVGGVHQLVGWVDDAGIVVVPDGTGVAGGVILVAPDEATATSRAQQLLGFVNLAALSANLTVHQETIAGTSVTFIEGNVGSLVPGAGSGAVPGVTLPAGAGTFSIAIASRGPAVYIGSGATFAHQVLELAAGSSLADQPAYQALVKRTSATAAGEVYVSASRLVALADGALPADARASFETDLKPYLDPLDSAFTTWWHEGDLIHQRLLITVK